MRARKKGSCVVILGQSRKTDWPFVLERFAVMLMEMKTGTLVGSAREIVNGAVDILWRCRMGGVFVFSFSRRRC